MILINKLWTLHVKDLTESDILKWGDIKKYLQAFYIYNYEYYMIKGMEWNKHYWKFK
jgi:hypothetical protein